MKRKRWVAVFLSLVLILSMGSPVSVQGYSGNSSGSGEEYSMSQTDEKSSENVQETSESEEVLEETTVKEETNSDETTVTESETVTEQTSEEDLKETVPDSEIVTDETSEDVENSVFPAQDFSGEANDVAVTVNAPEGAFPEGTTMNVTEADEESVQAAADVANASTSDVKAVEITFTSAGEEIEPAAAVKVTLKSNLIADVEEPIVVHVDDEKKAEVVTNVTKEEEAVSFEADAFSDYALIVPQVNSNENVDTYADEPTESTNRILSISYVFEDNTPAAQTWSASLAEGSTYSNTIAYPEIVGYEPAIPTVPTGVTADENGITFNLTVQNDIEINVIYKPANVNYTINYYQQNVDDDNYTLAETETKTGLTGSSIGITHADVENKYAGFYALLFDESATIAADGSTVVEIYYDRNYYLMSFDLGGGYGVEPIYARYGAEIRVGDPIRPGYTFQGWNKSIPATMPAENSTYTAQWTAGNAGYTVVFWYENADDEGYSYVGSTTGSAAAGTELESYDFRNTNFSGHDSAHFTYNAEMAETATVAGDGSTVLNVYFTRNTYTLTFRVNNGSLWRPNYSTVATITAKYDAEISGEFNKAPFNTTYDGRAWEDTGNTYDYALQTLDRMPGTNVTFNLYNKSSNTLKTINYYVQTVDSTNDLTDWPQNSQPTDDYELMKSVNTYFNYATYEEEYHEILGFTRFSRSEAGFDYSNQKNFSNRQLNLFYIRNSYDLRFYNYNGFVDDHQASVKYQANLGSYDFTPEYPSTLEAGAYEFAGWYLNPECTGEQVDLSTRTMPAADLTLYAKWVPVTHSVTTYMDSTLETQIGESQAVAHGAFATAPEQPSNGNYTFVGWFYMDNGVEKAFDFDSMPVRKDLDVYAKWSSNVLVEYTINYQLEDGTAIADPTTGSALAGTTRTFEAKTGDQLYADYQTGYFPIVSSHSLIMDIAGGENNVYTFVYREAQIVPYTVKYLDAETNEPIADDKVVSDNTYAVVTETAATVSGWLPDAFQKRLILTVPETGEPTAEDNVLIFYYTKDSEHAIVSTTHYLVDGSVVTEYQHSEEIGTIGQTYTREALEISEYEMYRVTINGEEWTEEDDPFAELTGEGLNFEFYYKIPYFYVYHSSDQSVETIDVPESGTYDLTKLVKSGYLYGGYYRDYKDAGSYNGGPDATNDGVNYAGGTDSWNASDIYTVKGTEMTPVGGQTYYLKEVPDTYLRPATYVVYDTIDNNQIVQLYMLTAMDDENYRSVGFNATGTKNIDPANETGIAAELYDQMIVDKEGYDTPYQTLTPSDIFGVSGYLAASGNKDNYIVENGIYTQVPYYVTLDGVTVTGCQKLKVCLRDTTFNDWKQPGITKLALKSTISAQ
ncbi:InlB B-repeat-containing protein [Lacrimispora saccharolytica]|nr:InlB B-repeat-containing protein [Lacrimispora saccharolytica]